MKLDVIQEASLYRSAIHNPFILFHKIKKTLG